MLLRGLLWFAWSLLGSCLLAQTVQPVISEYQVKADGKFALTNGTLTPMVVVLEPKSFSITPDGQGIFRSLDQDIHVELSAMSARLEPGQTYYVFYKARADQLPAWFTVYSTFSSLQHHPGLERKERIFQEPRLPAQQHRHGVEQPHPIQRRGYTEPKNAQIMHLSFSIAGGRRIQELEARIQKEELFSF